MPDAAPDPDKSTLDRIEAGIDDAIIKVLENGYTAQNAKGDAVELSVPPAFIQAALRRAEQLRRNTPTDELSGQSKMHERLARLRDEAGGGLPELDTGGDDAGLRE